MTTDAFLAHLAASTTANGWPWKYSSFVGLHILPHLCCPLTVFEGLDRTRWEECAERLGLSNEDARRIRAAADCDYEHDRELRKRLLAACGLTGGHQ